MRTPDLLTETALSLSSNKVRSGLTILGIVVGIASVIVMVAIGRGTQSSIESSIQSAGSNLLMVTPGGERRAGRSSGKSLTTEDAAAILEQAEGVAAVAPELTQFGQVVAGRNSSMVQVVGATADYAAVKSLTTSSGVFLSERDDQAGAKVAVLGPSAAEELFGEGVDPLGRKVRVGGITFKIIGMTASKGGSGFFNSDSAVYVPLTTMQRLMTGSDEVSTINVQAKDSGSMDLAKQSVTTLMLTRQGVGDSASAQFQVVSQADILATASTVTGTFTVLLASIAGISLLVGGIGIMNMMLTTVTERTREIGLRKAVGATRWDVTTQFLAESVTLTIIGGVAGILSGWLVSLAVSRFAGINTQVAPGAVLLAVGVCAGIGIVFGYYPAWRAARLSPMEALRYQ